MDKFSVPDEIKAHVDSMKSIIRSGIRAAVDLELSPLIDLPAVTNIVGVHASVAVRANCLIETLEQVIRVRLQGVDRRNALILFGFGEFAGLSMQDRFELAAKSCRDHWKWDDYRKGQLDKHLCAVYLGLYYDGAHFQDRAHGSRSARAGTVRQPLVGGDFTVSRYEVTYNLPVRPGDPREILEVRTIRASIAGLQSWQASTHYWGKGNCPPEVTLFGPGQLEITSDSVAAARDGMVYIQRVIFPEPLDVGEEVTFVLLKRQAVEFGDIIRGDGWRDRHMITPTNQVDFARIWVRFPSNHQPSVVWHFEDLPENLAPGVPTVANTLKIDSTGFAQYSGWDDLFIGHSYGLAWDW